MSTTLLNVNSNRDAAQTIADLSAKLNPWSNYSKSFRGTPSYEGAGKSDTVRSLDFQYLTECDYWIYSFETPIAWHHPVAGWTRTTESYSVTTTKHMGKLYRLESTND